VRKVNCQYTLGVYTRWDECQNEENEEDGNATPEEVRRELQEDYRKYVATGQEDKDQVFFVNVKSVQEIKVSVSS